MRGNQTIVMDPVQHAFADDLNPALAPGDWPKVRKSLGRARHYAEKLDWTVVRPDPGVCSTSFCIAESDARFLVYQTDNDSFQVSTGPGMYSRQWLNDANGMVIDHASLTITGTSQSFSPPFVGPSVLLSRSVERS